MCGIFGAVLRGPARDGAEELGRRAAAALAHRGPDAQAHWLDDAAGLVLAHTRLSVLDLSPAGDQPMVSRSGRHVLVFNGEIYNHQDLRAALGQADGGWRGHSDTETMVEAIARWGVEETLRRTDGMFAIGVWDREERALTLARDRLGEKPLYWATGSWGAAFASEMRAMRLVPSIDCSIDPEAVGSLLRWGFVAHPRTICAGVRQLAPGSLVTIARDGTAEEQVWWSLPDVIARARRNAPPADAADAAAQLLTRLRASVATRLEADVPLGAFLSGGMDSSLVAAVAQEALGSRRLRTFTIAMPSLGYDESAEAAGVARHLGTEHTCVELSAAEAMALIPKLPEIYDEPLADPSCLPSALVCAAARKELTVCLGGDGGDEVLGGYNRHVFGHALVSKTRRIPAPLRSGLGRALGAIRPSTYDAVGRALNPLTPTRFAIRNPGDKAHKLAALLDAKVDTWSSLASVWPEAAVRVGAPAFDPNPTVEDPVEAMMVIDTEVVLPDNMLVKIDRAAMAVGLEVRSPFLHHELVEWAWSVPLDMKVAGGSGKRPARDAVSRLLPASTAMKTKMGFDPPLGDWLRGPLRDWAGDLLFSGSLDPWLDPSAVRVCWDEHQARRRNNEYRLWAAITLSAWLRAHG